MPTYKNILTGEVVESYRKLSVTEYVKTFDTPYWSPFLATTAVTSSGPADPQTIEVVSGAQQFHIDNDTAAVLTIYLNSLKNPQTWTIGAGVIDDLRVTDLSEYLDRIIIVPSAAIASGLTVTQIGE